jgi:hypothetical protein
MAIESETASCRKVSTRIASLPETLETLLQPTFFEKVLGVLLRLPAVNQSKEMFRSLFRAAASNSDVRWKLLFFAEKNLLPLTSRPMLSRSPSKWSAIDFCAPLASLAG